MKFLVIGLGSMGKRRIRNLKYLGENDIIGFDFRKDRREESEDKYGIITFDNIDNAIEQKPDVFIISTPPNYHMEYELLAAKNNIHFFCEAGISTKNLDKLINLCKNKKIIVAPSATFRFKESIKKIKELIDNNKIGKIATLTYHMGQYLPDWHSWEDISEFYVGKKETAATKEMIPFELNWLTWILGDIIEISCMKGKISNLDVDIDDVYQVIFKYKNGVLGHILVDVVSRVPTRKLRIIGEEGTIEWDWNEDAVRLFDLNKKDWISFKEKEGLREEGYVAKEDMYIKEIENFLDAIKGNRNYIYSLEEDLKVLNLLKIAEISALEGKHIKSLE